MIIMKESIYFWIKLEEDLKIKFPFHLKNILNITGFSNALAFETINQIKIADIEEFVRDDLSNIIQCQEDRILEMIDPIHLFGLYAKNIQSFRFLAGEKSSLLAAVSYVKSEECGHFMMPNEYEVPKNDITETTIGLMFGRKFCNTSAPSGVVEVDEHHVVESEKVNYTELLEESEPDESLKSTLIEKLNNIVDSSRISRDMITVSNDGRRTVAHVECILCQEQNTRKLICVQYDLAKNSSKAYWNISNFKKHINGHISKKSGGENIVNLNSVESKQEKSLNLNVDDLKTTKSPVRLPKNSNTLKNLVKLSDQSRSNSPENNNGDLLGQQQSRKKKKLGY